MRSFLVLATALLTLPALAQTTNEHRLFLLPTARPVASGTTTLGLRTAVATTAAVGLPNGLSFSADLNVLPETEGQTDLNAKWTVHRGDRLSLAIGATSRWDAFNVSAPQGPQPYFAGTWVGGPVALSAVVSSVRSLPSVGAEVRLSPAVSALAEAGRFTRPLDSEAQNRDWAAVGARLSVRRVALDLGVVTSDFDDPVRSAGPWGSVGVGLGR